VVGEFYSRNGAALIEGPDGKTNDDAIVERFELTGVLETTCESPAIRFGPDGVEVKNLAQNIIVDSETRGLVGVEFDTPGTDGAGVARLKSNGSLDTSFGTGASAAVVPGFVLYRMLVDANNNPIIPS